MGICIDKLPHDCGTTKGLQVFANEVTGKVDGFCFSCSTKVDNPYGEPVDAKDIKLPEPKTEEQIQEEILEVSNYQVLTLPERKLRDSDLDPWGIKVSVKESDGKTPSAVYFPQTKDSKLVGYYVKTLGDNSFTFSLGDVKGCDPFGWDRALRSGAYRLIITEGQLDAVAVEKIYKTYTSDEDYMPAIISLSNGVNSVKSLASKAGTISKVFKEVVLCFDNDKAGKEAVEKAQVILPNALSVTLPYKDANDCVINGAKKAAYNALRFQATKAKNTRLILASDVWAEAREPTPYGELTWPYPTMQKLLRGIRLGETIYIGAGVKMGKSELLNDLACHFIMNDGVKVMVAKPEEPYKKTVKQMANKAVGYKFTDPDVEFDYELYDKAGDLISQSLYIVDLYQHIGWSSLKQDIIEAASNGCKAVFIDPITNLTAGMNPGDANTLLHEIAQDLSSMALDLNVVIFVFCHLKAHESNISKDVRDKKYKSGQYYKLGNCPHEYGGDILSNQFYGSRAMMQKCNLMLGLAGNKDEELDNVTKLMRWLCINEDREFGNSSSVPLIWNEHTTRYKEVGS